MSTKMKWQAIFLCLFISACASLPMPEKGPDEPKRFEDISGVQGSDYGDGLMPHELYDFENDEPFFITNTRAAGSKIKIASWNIENFSRNKTPAAITTISQVISKYDLIGIQEVVDTVGMRNLNTKLNQTSAGNPWYRITTPKKGRREREKECYGFIYNKNSIVKFNTGKFAAVKGMVRPMYYAYFGAVGTSPKTFDFIFGLVHTKPAPVKDLKNDLRLIKANFDDIKAKNSGEPDVIVAGDFNASPSYKWFKFYLGKLTAIIPAGSKTMVQGDKTNDNLIMGPPTSTEDYTGTKGVDEFDRTFNATGVSDHRLIWGEFHTMQDSQ